MQELREIRWRYEGGHWLSRTPAPMEGRLCRPTPAESLAPLNLLQSGNWSCLLQQVHKLECRMCTGSRGNCLSCSKQPWKIQAKQSETTFLGAGFLKYFHMLTNMLESHRDRGHGLQHFPNLFDSGGIPFQGTSITVFLSYSASQNRPGNWLECAAKTALCQDVNQILSSILGSYDSGFPWGSATGNAL